MSIKAVLRDFVKLHANEIGSNFRDVIQLKLCQMSEGICTRHGYILPGSIKVLSTSLGRMDGASLNGAVVYEAEYEAQLYNPTIGSRVKARVVNINRFGILAHAHMSDASIDSTSAMMTTRDVLEIIVAKQGGTVLASDVDLENVRIGDIVTVEILGKRFELNDTKISIIGKIIGVSQSIASSEVGDRQDEANEVFTDDAASDDSASGNGPDDLENSGEEDDEDDIDDNDDNDDDDDDDDKLSEQSGSQEDDDDDDDDDDELDINDFSDGSDDVGNSTDDGSDSSA